MRNSAFVPVPWFLEHRLLETEDSTFSEEIHRNIESVFFHCLSSDAYLLWGTGEDTSNSTMSLANVDGVQQCNNRCQYQMISGDIVHVLDSHSPAVHTEHEVCKVHNYKSTRYQMHQKMEQCKSILRAAVKSQLAFTSGWCQFMSDAINTCNIIVKFAANNDIPFPVFDKNSRNCN